MNSYTGGFGGVGNSAPPEQLILGCLEELRAVHVRGEAMPFTTSSFDRRLASLERAEAGRFGRPLTDSPFARVAFARRLASPSTAKLADAAALSRGPALFFQS